MSMVGIAINTFEHFQEKINMPYHIYSLKKCSKLVSAALPGTFKYPSVCFYVDNIFLYMMSQHFTM